MKHVPVNEIMIGTDGYLTVSQEDTVKEAIKKLQSSFRLDENSVTQGHTSVLVTGDNGKLVGILTIRGILKALVMHEKDKELPPNYLWTLFVSKSYESAAEIPVKKIMKNRKVFSVAPNDDIMEAVHKIVENKVNTLPVVEEGRPVGVIRAKDIFVRIGELLD